MLPDTLKINIDKVWESFWPGNTLKPIAVADFFACLFFLKNLDQLQLAKEVKATGTAIAEPIYTNAEAHLRWHVFKEYNAEELYQVFTGDDGVFDFLKKDIYTNTLAQSFARMPVSIIPASRLLAGSVQLVETIGQQPQPVQGAAFEYILSKITTAEKIESFPTPRHIVKLIVEMMDPAADDVIYDPFAGTGGVLVMAAGFLQKKYVGEKIRTPLLSGKEADPVLYRIGAVNMLLHAMPLSGLLQVDAFADRDAVAGAVPSLVISNPPFKTGPNKPVLETRSRYATADIFDVSLLPVKEGGRVALLIPDHLFFSDDAIQKDLRKSLLDKYRLDAVIGLPETVFRPFATIKTSLLFITKSSAQPNDRTWFYKLEKDGFSLPLKTLPVDANATPGQKMFPYDYGDIPDLLDRWKMRLDERKSKRVNGFFVPVSEIKAAEYNLRIKDYSQPLHTTRKHNAIIFNEPEPLAPNNDVLFTELAGAKEKRTPTPAASPSKKRMNPAVLALLLLLGLGGVAGYFLFFKTGEKKVLSANSTELPVDTTTITAAQPPVVSATPAADNIEEVKPVEPLKKKTKTNVIVQSPSQDLEPTTVAHTQTTMQYKVISKAYFHNEPNERTRRAAFVNHWNNSYATIAPLADENGFIYVVFTNHLGQTSRGWLRKKDLTPVRTVYSDLDLK